MPEPLKKRHLLGLETSGIVSGIGVSAEGNILGHISLAIKNIHSRRLALLVDQLLHHVDLSYDQLSAIVVSAGPGSFTGLRIGYSLAKGLAHALRIPIIEIPTLDIWAFQNGKTDRRVLSIIDAHRDEVFLAEYEWSGNECIRQTEYLISPISQISGMLDGRTILVGGDLGHLGRKFNEYYGKMTVIQTPLLKEPSSWALLQLGYGKFEKQEFSRVETCEPLYLRKFKGVM